MIDFLNFIHEYSNDFGVMLLMAGVYFMAQLQKSIEKLNTSIAVIIERVDNHEKRLDRLEDYK